jgi:hypothetical protein
VERKKNEDKRENRKKTDIGTKGDRRTDGKIDRKKERKE